MSLDSNTTELNDILDMAKGLPEAGVQEIVYVDCEFDMSALSLTSIAATYDEITAMIEAGKYVIARVKYALFSDPVNISLLPFTTWAKEQELVMCSAILQSRLNNQQVVLNLTGMLFASGSLVTNVKVVSVTDLN